MAGKISSQEEKYAAGAARLSAAAAYPEELELLRGMIPVLPTEELFEIWNSPVGGYFGFAIFSTLEERGVAESEGWAESGWDLRFGYDFTMTTDRGNYASVTGWKVLPQFRGFLKRNWELEVFGHLEGYRKAWEKEE